MPFPDVCVPDEHATARLIQTSSHRQLAMDRIMDRRGDRKRGYTNIYISNLCYLMENENKTKRKKNQAEALDLDASINIQWDALAAGSLDAAS